MPKKSNRTSKTQPTLRSTSGAGFEFEDLISAWLMVKMLAAEEAPIIGGVGIQIQAQVCALGLDIDDLLLTSRDNIGQERKLAISAKGNVQVNSAGLPADFVKRAWKQYRVLANPSGDGLALITQGTHHTFDPIWRDVKDACTNSDVDFALSRIQANTNQSRVFTSIQDPGAEGPLGSAQETVDLIRVLHVLALDFQSPYSEKKATAITQCRQLLESRDTAEANKLWQSLVNVASEIRVRRGTITLNELLSSLRADFALRHHNDFAREWETLHNITADVKDRIKINLQSGYTIPRIEEKQKLTRTISTNLVTVVFGESGSGKSALVKSVLDQNFGDWTQVWLGPESLATALSAANRRSLPIAHELSKILNMAVTRKNVLVIDSAERTNPIDFVVINNLFNSLLTPQKEIERSLWHIIVISLNGFEGTEEILANRQPAPLNLPPLKISEVKSVLISSPVSSWLASHEDTVSVLTNLKVLDWLLKLGSGINPNATRLSSHTAVADRLWSYWTDDRWNLKKILMTLAKREASFERSFALSEMDMAEANLLTPLPDKLPLRLNIKTDRIEFEHGLAADWARFQLLKETWSDTLQWAAFSENPLWTNALRMLGQHLLRQVDDQKTAWDTAFAAAEGTALPLAGDILLDALCLDPNAEQFLTERVDLLFANNAKHLTKLLIRFQHIATTPIDGATSSPEWIRLHLETQFRSLILGRWFPVLRFLVSHKDRLSDLESPSVAKVIKTWLKGTSKVYADGTQTPYRRELTEIALSMARSIQVKKASGVMYLECDSLMYTAVLAGAEDLPEKIGDWALELAGRSEIDSNVFERISTARHEKSQQHKERLKSDPAYKARNEKARTFPTSLSSFREKLPPWPLGARGGEIDRNFRQACILGNGLQTLMRVQPLVAAEVLLALIIEDRPERNYESSRYEANLGLEFTQDAYPTAFWKTPFIYFLQVAPQTALKAIIDLTNFCTERWTSQAMEGHEGESPNLNITFSDNSEKTFNGWWQVFGWVQQSSSHNGNLFCALDALERWLTLQLDSGVDITKYIDQIMQDGQSAALISLLVNVGKYQCSLFAGQLGPVLTDQNVFLWDSHRTNNVVSTFNSFSGSWVRDGEKIFDIARDWALAPHRKLTLQSVVVDLLNVDSTVAEHIQTIMLRWSPPEDEKLALEFKLLCAALTRENYQNVGDSNAGVQPWKLVIPEELRIQIGAFLAKNAESQQYEMLPNQCERFLEANQLVSDEQAETLYRLLKSEIAFLEDENLKCECQLAVAATLIVLADSWLVKSPAAKTDVLTIVKASLSEIATWHEEIRDNRINHLQIELKFTAHVAMHLWMQGNDESLFWESSVLQLLTSGNLQVASTVIGIAHANRETLGAAWWRLLQAGILFSGLTFLSPGYGDDENSKRAWNVWLARLRQFRLSDKNATIDSLRLNRVAAGIERLAFYRRTRLFVSGDAHWHREPERRTGYNLNWQFLETMFQWLVSEKEISNWTESSKLLGTLWECKIDRSRARANEETGEYELLQNFGYTIVSKLGELTLAATAAQSRKLWESVLEHGPQAHSALQHFIRCLFQHLSNGCSPQNFERVWREIANYGLSATWGEQRLWHYSRRLMCDIIGFGNESALMKLGPGAVLLMRDIYERWAESHLSHCDEECVRRFCYFLIEEFGAPLRLEGLRWIAKVLKEHNPKHYWYRNNAGVALVGLVSTSLAKDGRALANDKLARQALVEISSALVQKQIPNSLAVHERIKHLAR